MQNAAGIMTVFVFISLRTFLSVLYCAQPLQHHLNLVRNLSSIENFRCLLAAPTCLLDKSHGCWMPPTVVPRDLVHCSLPSHAGIDCHLPLLMNSAPVGNSPCIGKERFALSPFPHTAGICCIAASLTCRVPMWPARAMN